MNHLAATDPQTGNPTPLFHPNQQAWTDHFRWEENGLQIMGLTPIGRATVSLLRLNRALLLRARERWIYAGWHPPEE